MDNKYINRYPNALEEMREYKKTYGITNECIENLQKANKPKCISEKVPLFWMPRRIKRQTLINKSRKSRFRSAIKKINLLIEKKDKKGALSFLPKLNSELMKVAKTGVIKKQNASRNVSRITKKVNSL